MRISPKNADTANLSSSFNSEYHRIRFISIDAFSRLIDRPWRNLLLSSWLHPTCARAHQSSIATDRWVQAIQTLPAGKGEGLKKVEGFCQVVEEAVAIGHKDLDRLILARELMDRVTRTGRANAKLSELVDLFLSRPSVTVPLGAKVLKMTPKAVDLMLAQLGGALPRELTGRTRYRAWGIV
ncbi:helix-turn-helix domain-containing protein [Microvirga sp. G4-2]|uniref:helix-turn-helix domain-containing protein n=1 Tax=Microvirga sp. G4-2 TaxID=3434467 RepID=UPI004044A7E7